MSNHRSIIIWISDSVPGLEEIIAHGLSEKTLDVNGKNAHDQTMLDAAVQVGNTSIAKILIEAGAVIKRDYQQQLLYNSCLRLDYEMVKVLLEYGADVKWQNGCGLSCLQGLLGHHCLEYISKYNEDTPKMKNRAEIASKKIYDIAELLIRHDEDVNYESWFNSALFKTYQYDKRYIYATRRLLLEAGAKIPVDEVRKAINNPIMVEEFIDENFHLLQIKQNVKKNIEIKKSQFKPDIYEYLDTSGVLAKWRARLEQQAIETTVASDSDLVILSSENVQPNNSSHKPKTARKSKL